MESKCGDDFVLFTILFMFYCLINCVAIILDPASMLKSTLRPFAHSLPKENKMNLIYNVSYTILTIFTFPGVVQSRIPSEQSDILGVEVTHVDYH